METHQTKPIGEAKGATILRDFAIQIGRKIKDNRPDLVVKDYKRKTCFVIDMSVPTDYNISVNGYNKISNYKVLEIEIEKNVAP